MADDVHLTIDQGATWAIGFPILDKNGGRIDLTGYSGRSQVRPNVRSETVYFEWSSDPSAAQGRMSFDLGQVNLEVTPEQSNDWSWRMGVFDLELVSPDGEVWRPIRGTVWVDRQVTR